MNGGKNRTVDRKQNRYRFLPRRFPKGQAQHTPKEEFLQYRHQNAGGQSPHPQVKARDARPVPDSQKILDPRGRRHHEDPQNSPPQDPQTDRCPVSSRKKSLWAILPKPEQNRNQRQRHPQLDPPKNSCGGKHIRHHRLHGRPHHRKQQRGRYDPHTQKSRHPLPSSIHGLILSHSPTS